MRPLPNITGTVGNWPLNGSLVDVSGMSPALQSVDPAVETPVAPLYVTFDACTQGVECLNGTSGKLMASAPLLRFTGAFTFQWVMVQLRTYELTYFCCCDPTLGAPGLRNGGPDRLGSLYTIHSSGGNCTIADQSIGSNLPSPFYGVISGSNNTTWGGVPGSPPPYANPAVYAFTCDSSGNYSAYKWTAPGVGGLVGTVAHYGSAKTSNGTENFYIGGIESGVPPIYGVGYSGGATFANVRALNYARAASDLAADAAAMFGNCATALSYRGLLVNIRKAST